MSNSTLSHVRLVDGRLMHFSQNGLPFRSPIIIPYGSIVRLDNHSIEVIHDGPTITEITAVPTSSTARRIRIYPSFSSIESIFDSRGRERRIEFYLVSDHKDHLNGVHLIAKEHYLPPPRTGVMLACKLQDDPSRRSGVGGIIGCALLDTLYYADPNGRAHIAKDAGSTELLDGGIEVRLKRDLDLGEVLAKIPIVWGRRFAVDSEFHGLGIGTLLAKKIRLIAREYIIPHAEYIEVITTRPSDAVRSLLGLGNVGGDFLQKAGYNLVREARPSKPFREVDEANPLQTKPIRTKKLYYWVKTYV